MEHTQLTGRVGKASSRKQSLQRLKTSAQLAKDLAVINTDVSNTFAQVAKYLKGKIIEMGTGEGKFVFHSGAMTISFTYTGKEISLRYGGYTYTQNVQNPKLAYIEYKAPQLSDENELLQQSDPITFTHNDLKYMLENIDSYSVQGFIPLELGDGGKNIQKGTISRITGILNMLKGKAAL